MEQTCINLPCDDCSIREVPVCISIDIFPEDMREAYESGFLCITPEQVRQLGLNPGDYVVNEDGLICIDSAEAGIEASVCSSCGSDQTYDSEGNNITAL